MAKQVKPTPEERVSALLREGKKGVEIALAMKRGGYGIIETRDALSKQGFVVDIEEASPPLLHVSSEPMAAGFAVLIASAETRALPEVVWS